MVALVYTTVLASLVVFGVARLSALHEESRALAARTTEARDRLRTVELESARAGEAFNAALLQRDVDARGAAMFTAYERFAAIEKAWSQYVALSVGLPGEERLAREYEGGQFGTTEAGERLATLALKIEDLDDPELQGAMDEYFADQGRSAELAQLITMYEDEVDRRLAELGRIADDTEHQLVYFALAASFAAGALAAAFVRGLRVRDREVAALEAEQAHVGERNAFEAMLQRALEMSVDERGVYDLVDHALPEAARDHPSDVLVADGSGSMFRPLGDTDSPLCEVRSPDQCVAARRGQPLVFPSSGALDACPWLRGRPGGSCSAVCTPVHVAGRPAAVLHATGSDGEPPGELVVERLTLLAQKVGEKLGMLRAFARSETEAATDPLTGLLNRRSFRTRVLRVTEGGEPYAVLYADLDHFKVLNDSFGHETGDRALRTFARTLRGQLRPEDVVCRYGGEEFVVVLPDCELPHARAVAERIRAAVEHAHDASRVPVPVMTVSIGVATSGQAALFDDVVDLADQALLAAKVAGRNRVLAAEDSPDATADADAPAPIADAPAAASDEPLSGAA